MSAVSTWSAPNSFLWYATLLAVYSPYLDWLERTKASCVTVSAILIWSVPNAPSWICRARWYDLIAFSKSLWLLYAWPRFNKRAEISRWSSGSAFSLITEARSHGLVALSYCLCLMYSWARFKRCRRLQNLGGCRYSWTWRTSRFILPTRLQLSRWSRSPWGSCAILYRVRFLCCKLHYRRRLFHRPQ